MVGLRDIAAQRAGRGRGGGRNNAVVRMPAPTRGWNARDAYEAMDPKDAITLENWIPGLLGVRLRKGHQPYATGLGVSVETLMEYAPKSATGRKFFGAAGANIYDISASGAVGAAVQTGLTSALWQSTMIATAAGTFLFLVNGSNDPRYYDGSAWTVPVITGVGLTNSNLIHVVLHKFRLWFIEKNTMNAWYLDTNAVSGTITKFPLGGLFKLGGELMALGTWSRDGGAGQDDLFVAITSEGEVAVYSGTDPASATTWALVGVFRIPRPVGRRCIVKAGGDLGILTIDGPVSLELSLSSAQSAQRRTTLTDRISEAFRTAYSIAPTSTAWGILEAPGEGIIVMNVPGASVAASRQYIMSSDTGGWADWSNINAVCLGLFNDELYFGKSDGTVHKYGTTFSDGPNPITARLQTAFVALQGVEEKRFTMVRPVMQGRPGYSPAFAIRTNYDTSPPNITNITVSTGGTVWDEGDWDVSEWDTSPLPVTKWQSVSGLGSVVSLALSISTDIDVTLQAVDLMFDLGGPL